MRAVMSDEVSAGQAVSDWALVRFPRKFASNKFRDGSWAEQPAGQQSFGVGAILTVIVACSIFAFVCGFQLILH